MLFPCTRPFHITRPRFLLKFNKLALVQLCDGLLLLLYFGVEWVSSELLPSDGVVDLLSSEPIRNDPPKLLRLFIVLIMINFLDRWLSIMNRSQHQKVAVDLLFKLSFACHKV